MSRKWLLFPFCLSMLFLLAPLSSASLTLRVNESATRVVFGEEGTRVLLAIENSLGRRVDAQVQIELIDIDGAIRARSQTNNQINTGARPEGSRWDDSAHDGCRAWAGSDRLTLDSGRRTD